MNKKEYKQTNEYKQFKKSFRIYLILFFSLIVLLLNLVYTSLIQKIFVNSGLISFIGIKLIVMVLIIVLFEFTSKYNIKLEKQAIVLEKLKKEIK